MHDDDDDDDDDDEKVNGKYENIPFPVTKEMLHLEFQRLLLFFFLKNVSLEISRHSELTLELICCYGNRLTTDRFFKYTHVAGWSRLRSHLDYCGGRFKFSGQEPGAASIRSSDVS